jgi:anaerobic selenocysteine-containing dehydrogenase
MLGADPLESNGSLATAPDFPGRLADLRARGGKLVVVDPRRSKTARAADEHVFIHPGTDAMFLAAIVEVLFAEQLVTLGRLEAMAAGVSDVEDAVGPFTPDAVAAATGIEAAVTRRIARELASAPTAVVYGRVGTHTVEFGTLSSWLVDVINTLTGNLDSPGGAMFPLPAHARRHAGPGGRGFVTGRWHSRVRGLPEVLGELPVATLADEILMPGEGQIRALVTIAGNPVLSTPDSERLDEALASLELVVSVDPYRNETTRHADVLLPPPPPLERPHYDFAFYSLSVRNVANYSPPVIELSDGSMAEWEILARLGAIASGFGAATPAAMVDDYILRQMVERDVRDERSPIAGRDVDEIVAALGGAPGPERMLDFLVRTGPYGDGFGADPDGLTLEALRRHAHGIDLGALTPVFPEAITTQSGMIELAPEAIIPDVPRLVEALSRARNGEMLLVGRRHIRSNNSWMHNIDVLVRGAERCTLLVHPDDAARLGLTDGASASIASRVGKVVAPAEITDDMMRGVVSLPHGWGHDLDGAQLAVAAERPGANLNALMDEGRRDPLSGNAVLSGVAVSVAAA